MWVWNPTLEDLFCCVFLSRNLAVLVYWVEFYFALVFLLLFFESTVMRMCVDCDVLLEKNVEFNINFLLFLFTLFFFLWFLSSERISVCFELWDSICLKHLFSEILEVICFKNGRCNVSEYTWNFTKRNLELTSSPF